MVAVTEGAVGIFQADVIIQTALTEALADLRRNPWLLDFVFASLPKDTTSASKYGLKEVESAKAWFRRTDIAILFTRPPDGNPPKAAVSIRLLSCSEDKNTLGDVHYTPHDTAQAEWPPLTSRFSPESYTRSTGIMILPESVTDQLVVVAGMFVVDRHGGEHEILSATDETIEIEETNADFSESFIKAAPPSMLVSMESCVCKEAYEIGCHVIGDDAQPALWLHSIVTFCLLRYRQRLLEARGFQGSAITTGQFALDQETLQDLSYARFITLSGLVTQTWPKDVSAKLTNVNVQLSITDSGNAPDSDLTVLGWVGSDDIQSF